jgi:hypothetical protein
MRNMNSTKRRWPGAALACALAVTAMLAAAPAWAYTATVKNQTKHNVKVEVFEVRFIGVFNSVGSKMLGPGESAEFHTNGAFCIYRYEGWYVETDPSTWKTKSQHWEAKANPDGAMCTGQQVTVKKRDNGTFYFKLFY